MDKRELTASVLANRPFAGGATDGIRRLQLRAIAVRRFGETSSVEELPKPEAKEGEVFVHLRAAGVNAMDPILTTGMYKEMMEHRLPFAMRETLRQLADVIGICASGRRSAWEAADLCSGMYPRPNPRSR